MAGDCGTCTMCCKVMGVSELDKPKNTQCEHCAIGKGCKIYDDRPVSCKEFRCIWLQSQTLHAAMDLKMRPDKSKVILHTTVGEDVVVAKCDPKYPDAWRWKGIGLLLGKLSEKCLVLVDNGKQYWLLEKGQAKEVNMSAPDKDGFEHFEGFSAFAKMKSIMVKER
jgi:hypothetical protein